MHAECSQRYAVVDTGHSPILHVRVVGPLNDATYAAHLEELAAALDATPRFALVLEQGPLRAFPIRFVRKTSSWIRAAVERHGDRWVSTAYVIDQKPLVAVVRGLFWAVDYPTPVHVTPSREAAFAWSRARLVEAGVPPAATSSTPVDAERAP